MALNKYKGFIDGDILPAENINSIDPDKQSEFSEVTSGENTSSLAVFQGLINSDNKIKVVSGDIEKDQQVKMFNFGTPTNYLAQNNQYTFSGGISGESFVAQANAYLTSIDLYFQNSGVAQTLSLRLGQDINGVVLATSGVITISGITTFTFSEPVYITAGTTYCFTISNTATPVMYWSGTFANCAGYSGSWSASTHFYFIIKQVAKVGLASLNEVATALQTAISTATSSNSTVVYEAGKFKITSGVKNTPLFIYKADSGFDISGETSDGSGKFYLDLTQNALYDNYFSYSGYLNGGNQFSDYNTFLSLANGANDGKVKVNIDGVEYDNVAVNLDPNYSIASSVLNSSYNLGGNSLNSCLYISPDGLNLYAFNGSSYNINQYTMTTAWDLKTLSSAPKIKYLGLSNVLDIKLSKDGTKLYFYQSGAGSIRQWTLSTAWDITTAVDASKSLSVGGQGGPNKFTISNDGTKIYTLTNAWVYQYTLSTAWDISTGSYANKSKNFSSQITSGYGIVIRFDGKKVFIGSNGGAVHQYTLSTAWDISTATYDNLSSVFQMGYNLVISDNGKNIYTNLYTNSEIKKYSNSTWKPTNLLEVAEILQTSIRIATGKTEKVGFYNKFIVTSSTKGRESKVLKFTSPTNGTDLSGNGTTKYFDLGNNATEFLGDGNEFFILRLDKDSKIPYTALNDVIGEGLILYLNCVASDNLRVYKDELTSLSGSTGGYLRQIRVGKTGTIRVRVDTAKDPSYTGGFAIYVNGVNTVALGLNNYPNFFTSMVDVTVKAGDLIQVYSSQGQSSSIGYCKNFRIYYTPTPASDIIIQ